ncbi:hypothetical protein K3495_g9576 [Podosphaera aphanis]|nr:hypothetical protein K3495_g9576 [Podosphaera aphanis]
MRKISKHPTRDVTGSIRDDNTCTLILQYNIKFERTTYINKGFFSTNNKEWQQTVRFESRAKFARVAEKKNYTLEEKDIRNYPDKGDVPIQAEIIPVIRIFSYKYD